MILHSTGPPSERGNASRFPWLHGLSIGTRLAFGFGLIAALFLVANYVSQRNAASVTTQSEISNRVNRNLDRTGRSLAEHLTAFHRSLRERIALDNLGETRHLYAAADAALSTAVDDYANLDSQVHGTLPADKLAGTVQSLQTRATALLQSTKRRDELLARYWSGLDRLQQRLADTEQNMWRIGDRALSRRSATTTADALLVVRNAVAANLASPSAQRAALIDLYEENFLIALARNSKALAAAKGDAWLTTIRGEFDQLRRLQRDARATRDNVQLEFAAISTDIDNLLKTIRADIGEPATKALLDSAKLAGEIAQREQRNFSFLSIGSLAVILIISLLTAKSVTVPISRLIQATYRLGLGDDVAQVERGGMRELDQLAAAFNAMVERLAEANRGVREQQTKLEERVTERTHQLHHLAYHDALTHLPNRRYLFKHLNTTLEQARSEGRSVVLLLLDLDNFKTLNDSLGHLFGDRVLKAVSQRLLEVVEHDGFAARLGGDEFTIVRELRPSSEGIATQTERLLARFQQPLSVGDREIIVGLSVGAGVYPDHAQDAESLLRAADGALFKAKALGRNQTCISSPELVEQITLQFKTEQALRRAIQCNELEILYQPQVRLSNREVTAVEALLRWKRDGVYVLPLDFLPLAEQSGLIAEITDWVLTRSIEALAEWHHGSWPQARVAVNISSQQFIDRTFVSRLQALLQSYKVPPSNLELELTETVLQSGAATVTTLQELRDLGVRIALDDFGAGYSSLASLEKLQLSRVKIDHSLMENVDRNPRSGSIARSMIALCRSLNLQVTAEGVERIEQLRFLELCEEVDVQGFLLASPLAANHVLKAVSELPHRMADISNSVDVAKRDTPSSIASTIAVSELTELSAWDCLRSRRPRATRRSSFTIG